MSPARAVRRGLVAPLFAAALGMTEGGAAPLATYTVTPDNGSLTVQGGASYYTATFTITNNSSSSDALDHYCEVAGDVSACEVQESGLIALPGSGQVQVDVRFWASQGSGSVTIYTLGMGGFEEGSHNVTITAAPVVLVSFVTGSDTISAGQLRSYSFRIKNVSTASDLFTLSCTITSGPASCAGPSPDTVTIAAGDSVLRIVDVTGGSSAGTATVKVTATATATGFATKSIVVIKPPRTFVVSPYGDRAVRWGCPTFGTGPQSAAQCGDLLFAHAFPGYRSANKQRNVTLLYNSATVTLRPSVAVDYTINPGDPLPDSLRLDVYHVSGSPVLVGRTYYATSGFQSYDVRRLTMPVNADSLGWSTGAYPIRIDLARKLSGGWVTDTVTRNLLVVDRRASPFGAGWWPAGIERLYPGSTGALLVHGDGSAVFFRKNGSAYEAPPGEYSALATQGSGFQRTLPGNRVSVSYDSSGVTTSVVEDNPTDNVATYWWSGTRIDSIVDAAGYKLKFLPNGASRIQRIVIPGVDSIRLTQAVPSGGTYADLTTIEDPDGYQTAMTYAAATHRMATSKARGTSTVSYWFHPTVAVLDSVSAPAGVSAPKRHLRSWQGAGAPTTANPGSSSQPTITSQPWLAQVRLAMRRQDIYVNDSVIVRMAMHPSGVPAWVEKPNGYRTYLHRDSVGNAVLIEDSLGVWVRQVWDTRGRLTLSIQKHRSGWHDINTVREDSTVYGYDSTWEELTRIVPPLKTDSVRFTYDGHGRRITSWQGGLTTRIAYTARGQVDSIIAPHRTSSGEEQYPTVYGYDATTRNLVSVRQNTRESTYEYDPQVPTRLVSVTDPVGTEIRYTFDAMQRMDSVLTVGFDNKESLVRFAYDDAARTKTMTDPAGRQTTWTNDSAGRPIKECRPTGCEETAYGDGINPTWTKRRDNSVVTRTYTRLGQLQQARFNEDTIDFSYTAAGQPAVIRNTHALIRRTYDPYGRLTCERQRVRVWHDSAHLSDEDRFPAGVTAWHDYDRNGRRAKTFLGGVDCEPILEQEPTEGDPPYDPFAPLPAAFNSHVPQTDSMLFSFDTRGSLATIKNTYFNAGTNTWTYGYDNQLSVDSLWAPHTGGTLLTTWTRDAYGDLTAFSGGSWLSNGQYDDLGRLVSGTNGYGSITNHYDGLGRLDTAYRASSGITETYGYDPNGDRTSDLWSTYAFKTNGLLDTKTSKADGACIEYYTYDARGNLREQENDNSCSTFRREMWYDDADKMYESDTETSAGTTYCNSGPRVENRKFFYDGLGRRVLMLSGNSCADDKGYWRYFWIDDHVAARTWTLADPDDYWPSLGSVGQWFFYGSGMDNVLASRTYALGAPGFATFTGYHFLTDERGSIVAVKTHQNGIVSGTAPSYFTPFGSGAGGRETTPGFNGQDASGGLVYMRNRWYDPNTGRFTQGDPIGFAGGINLYGYAGGDPVTYSDPFGLDPDSTEGQKKDNCGPGTYCGAQLFAAQMAAKRQRINKATIEFAVGNVATAAAGAATSALVLRVAGTRIGALIGFPNPVKTGAGGQIQPFAAETGRYLSQSGNPGLAYSNAAVLSSNVAAGFLAQETGFALAPSPLPIGNAGQEFGRFLSIVSQPFR